MWLSDKEVSSVILKHVPVGWIRSNVDINLYSTIAHLWTTCAWWAIVTSLWVPFIAHKHVHMSIFSRTIKRKRPISQKQPKIVIYHVQKLPFWNKISEKKLLCRTYTTSWTKSDLSSLDKLFMFNLANSKMTSVNAWS